MIRSTIVIEVNNERQSLSYIVKCFLSSVYDEALTRESDAFPKEMKMYSEILPQFEKIYEEAGIEIKFGPKCFLVANEPCELIVMEDLVDFSMVDRKKGFDEDHVKLGLDWMAKFHAASFLYCEKFGGFDEKFKEGLYRESIKETYESYLNSYFDHFIEALKSLPNGESYIKKVMPWKGNLFTLMRETMKFDSSSLNVLNHGDTWVNNILFSYGESGVKSVRFVDYQIAYFGTIAQDLYHFMVSSWELKLKVTKFDEYILYYSKKLEESLKNLKFGGEIPSHEDILKELDKRKFWSE